MGVPRNASITLPVSRHSSIVLRTKKHRIDKIVSSLFVDFHRHSPLPKREVMQAALARSWSQVAGPSSGSNERENPGGSSPICRQLWKGHFSYRTLALRAPSPVYRFGGSTDAPLSDVRDAVALETPMRIPLKGASLPPPSHRQGSRYRSALRSLITSGLN